MKLEFVEGLIDLVERFGVIGLDYTEGGATVRISRARDVVEVHDGAAKDPERTSRPVTPDGADPPPPTPLGEREHILAAGTIGTFYRSPQPGEPPFVAEGDRVEEGQTLAILEAMKMLNPIEADRSGRVLRILVEDGDAVAAGTPLFAIAPMD